MDYDPIDNKENLSIFYGSDMRDDLTTFSKSH